MDTPSSNIQRLNFSQERPQLSSLLVVLLLDAFFQPPSPQRLPLSLHRFVNTLFPCPCPHPLPFLSLSLLALVSVPPQFLPYVF